MDSVIARIEKLQADSLDEFYTVAYGEYISIKEHASKNLTIIWKSWDDIYQWLNNLRLKSKKHENRNLKRNGNFGYGRFDSYGSCRRKGKI